MTTNEPVKRSMAMLPGGEYTPTEQLTLVTQIHFTVPPGMTNQEAHDLLAQRLKWWMEDPDNELRQAHGLFQGGDSDVEPCIATMTPHVRPRKDAADTSTAQTVGSTPDGRPTLSELEGKVWNALRVYGSRNAPELATTLEVPIERMQSVLRFLENHGLAERDADGQWWRRYYRNA